MQDTDNMQVLPPTDAEQTAMQKRRDKLPKFTLGRHERLYIPREEIEKLNDVYHQMLDDMKESPAKEDLRSYMESLIFASYVRDVEKKQREHYLESEAERERLDGLNGTVTPLRWRKWYFPFKLNKNQAQILLEELIGRQAHLYYRQKESELPIIESEEAEADPYAVQIETLRAYLPRMRKKKRAIIEEIIAGLAASFDNKVANLQHLNDELQAERSKVEELTAAVKKEAVQRLVNCLNAVKETKSPLELEILKLRKQLEEAQTTEGTPAEDELDEEESDENWDDLDELDEETDEIEHDDEAELEEENSDAGEAKSDDEGENE